MWPQIHAAWDGFAAFVAKAEPPPLSARDVRKRDDAEWLAAASMYPDAKRIADMATKTLEEAKERLIARAGHAKEQGGGVTVTRLFRRGNVDYKRIPAVVGVDLDQFRGSGREEVRVIADT